VYALGATARAGSKDSWSDRRASVIPMRRNTASSVLSSETGLLGQKIAGAGRISSTPAPPVNEASAHGCATYQSRELKLNHPPGFAARYSTREKTHS
jgi:hypothetical protein